MKKLICLLLVVVMTCTLLSGCELSGIFGTTTSTTPKRIEPSERDPILDEFVLDYTDDFSESDIEFIKHMYERNLTQFPPVNEMEKSPDFCSHMSQLDVNENTFYKINVDVEGKPYFIAVYGQLGGPYYIHLGGCIDMVKWRKYSEYADIPQTLDGEDLIGVYAVYDCVVEKDVINNVVYNYTTKYYLPIMDEYSPDNLAYTYGLYDSVLWCDSYGLFGRETSVTVLHTLYFFEDMTKDMYEYYIDENGIEYLVMPFKNYDCYNSVKWLFGSKYDEFSPYIIRNEALDDYYYDDGKITKSNKKYCIPVSLIVDICWKK